MKPAAPVTRIIARYPFSESVNYTAVLHTTFRVPHCRGGLDCWHPSASFLAHPQKTGETRQTGVRQVTVAIGNQGADRRRLTTHPVGESGPQREFPAIGRAYP